MLQAVERGETDIAAALRLAGWTLGARGAGRVLLVSDGWQTRGDARTAAMELARRGIAVDTLALDGTGVIDAAVDGLDLPGQVHLQAPFEIRATIASASRTPATVTLLEDGVERARESRDLAPGLTAVRFSVTAATAGMHRYGVKVTVAGDQQPRNDAAERPVQVVGRPRVLWAGTPPPALASLDVLHVTPGELASLSRRLGDFDAVVLANVESGDVPAPLFAGVPEYVGHAGGGLLMLGDRRSFGPGGYRATSVEAVLPVELDGGTRTARPRLAMALVLDKSGSMGEPMERGAKIDAARQAALAAAALLQEGDRLGVIAFDVVATTLLEPTDPQPAARLPAALASVVPGGGTRILPALDAAASMLRRVAIPRRHIVLLTDGHGEGGDLPAAAAALAAEGTTVSVVAIGEDADTPMLAALARAGGGRFAVARDAQALASVLRREVTVARAPLVHEGRTPILREAHPLLGAIGDGPIPPLLGYVSSRPKTHAVVPLRTEEGEPILAVGSFGLGRTAALLTDPQGAWGREWRAWPGSDRLMVALLRWLIRAPAAGQVSLEEQPEGERWAVRVRIDDAAGEPLDGARLVARLRSGESTRTLALEQRSVGLYGATLDSRPAVDTSVAIEDVTTGRLVGQGWIGLGYGEEYRLRGANEAVLGELRALTGGRVLGQRDVELRTAGGRSVHLWPALAVLALVAFLLDVAVTRGWPPRRAQVPRT